MSFETAQRADAVYAMLMHNILEMPEQRVTDHRVPSAVYAMLLSHVNRLNTKFSTDLAENICSDAIFFLKTEIKIFQVCRAQHMYGNTIIPPLGGGREGG